MFGAKRISEDRELADTNILLDAWNNRLALQVPYTVDPRNLQFDSVTLVIYTSCGCSIESEKTMRQTMIQMIADYSDTLLLPDLICQIIEDTVYPIQ